MCSCKTCGILAKTFSSRKDTETHYALAAMHIGTVERVGSAATGPGRQQMKLRDIRVTST
jgi:hypothetical protein